MKIKYILLNVGDIVEDGDQEYSPEGIDRIDMLDDSVSHPKWHDVSVTFIGEAVQENDPPVRRKMK